MPCALRTTFGPLICLRATRRATATCLRGVLAVGFGSGWLVGRAVAAESDPAIAAGRRALNQVIDPPWYDSSRDAQRAVELSEPWTWDWNFGGWLPNLWLDWLPWAAAAVLVVFLLAMAVAFWRAYRRAPKAAWERSARAPMRNDLTRIEAIPFLDRRNVTDLLAQARRHYEQGNYGEAMIFLFSHELVELDRHQRIVLHRGKTNRQYLRELSLDALRRLIERSMVAFESVFFGGHSLAREGFEARWNELAEFQRLATGGSA